MRRQPSASATNREGLGGLVNRCRKFVKHEADVLNVRRELLIPKTRR